MVGLDRGELNKLSLTERIKRLRQIEVDSKKDIEDAKKLIRETEDEIKTSDVASAIAPEPEKVDISKLFKQEEKETLEDQVGRKPVTEEELAAVEYARMPEGEPAALYNLAPTEPEAQRMKIEEQAIYRATSKDITEKSVASKAVLEETKKYTKG